MTDASKPSPPPGGQFLVYRTEDGKLKIDVRFEGETVWLTQQQMTELFQTTQQNISLHIQGIYEEGELELAATHKKSLSVRREGNREVRRCVDFYNLDMIISVGYRVKSVVATRFRIWATHERSRNQSRAHRPRLTSGRLGRGRGQPHPSRVPITKGRLEGHGRRGKQLTADYVLVYRNTKLAVVEAKAWDDPLREGPPTSATPPLRRRDFAGQAA